MYLHMILLLFGITYNSNTATFEDLSGFKTVQDSVYIDVDPIDKREYTDLKDKYDSSEFIYERTAKNSGWWTRFKQWLSDVFRDLFNINSDAKAADITDVILKIFYIVIVLLVVFFIVKAVLNREGSWVFGKSSDKSIIPVTDVENNIFETNFVTLIKDAEHNNNYRLAIRYYYLWLLKTLSESEIIDYDVEKTNSDYYNEIKNESTKKEFSYTSYLYNYIWYGEFDIDNTRFNKAKTAFTHFLNSIKK